MRRIISSIFIVTCFMIVGSTTGCVVFAAMFGIGPEDLASILGVSESAVDSGLLVMVFVMLALLAAGALVAAFQEQRMRHEAEAEEAKLRSRTRPLID